MKYVSLAIAILLLAMMPIVNAQTDGPMWNIIVRDPATTLVIQIRSSARLPSSWGSFIERAHRYSNNTSF